ncbi:MAG: Crp/Fnr family transcriptional regulator [Spirochaetales bacterium]|jgi:CRP/FNR family transcriptional regulator, dissimilatory nitrate respiration regulator|nr:Crp/Fnr family transcriptional regulator [Spirochaetales bacterium]
MDIKHKLLESDFFSSLSHANIELLAEICIPKQASRHETLFLEGQEGGLFFLLLSGRIQLYRLNADGREIAIKVIGPGEIFAEVILFEVDTYPVCAATISDCGLLAIPVFQFSCLLENPDFRDDFISMLMKKQRYLTSRIMYLTSHDVEARFFGFLEEQFGRQSEYLIALSKKDISTAIGATPETLSRLIQRLTLENLIMWKGKKLQVDEACWD